MRTALQFGRQCLRHRSPQLAARLLQRQFFAPHRCFSGFRRPPRPAGTKVTVLSLLTPAAFVALSEEQCGDGKTPEDHMLEASRAEIAKELPDDIHGLTRLWKGTCLCFDCYIFEPIATTFRFFHLVIIFVPVLVTIPLIWVGRRQKTRDGERSGTLWWYGFLVHSMERAGPAFIKVRSRCSFPPRLLTSSIARPMGSFSNRHLPA